MLVAILVLGHEVPPFYYPAITFLCLFKKGKASHARGHERQKNLVISSHHIAFYWNPTEYSVTKSVTECDEVTKHALSDSAQQ